MRDSMNFGALPGRLALATALVAVTTAAASATPAPFQGFQALVGCWEPVATARDSAPDIARGHLVCVVPIEGTSAVEFVTIVDGKAAERERVDASGTRQPLTRDDCSGWQSAEWSATGHRLYLRSELTCAGGLKRISTGVISMPISSEWVDVQSVAVGNTRAVRTLRYREARSYASVPAAEASALGSRAFSVATSTARLAASAPVTTADIVDVTRNLDAAAAEVWLAEQQLGFKADAGRLVQLADAGVPGRVIDMVVALSYPEQFTVAAVEQPDGAGDALARADRRYGMGGGYYDPFWDPYYGSRYDRRYYSPYGYSRYGNGYYYNGYDGGYYGGGRPIVIVVTPGAPSNTASRGGGRIVNGRGYTRPADPDPAVSTERPRTKSRGSSGTSDSGRKTDSSAGSSSNGSSGSSSGGSSSGGSSSGGSSSGERTAKRRPPPSGN